MPGWTQVAVNGCPSNSGDNREQNIEYKNALHKTGEKILKFTF